MPFLPHKSVLAIVAVTDVALNSRDRPVTAKALAKRHHLPSRHLERLLQALVREGILNGVLGPRGGYQLAREPRRITTDDILRAVRTVDDRTEAPVFDSLLIKKVVTPTLAKAENVFSKALARISIQDLTRSATALKVSK
jgi:Rrf2 family transcriptional regulator, iron-sulfur cluster assembly transcription factor